MLPLLKTLGKNKIMKKATTSLFRTVFYYGIKNFFDKQLVPYYKGDNKFKTGITSSIFTIYFHYPFCKTICAYCPFNKTSHLEMMDKYCETTIKELKLWAKDQNYEGVQFPAVHFGGGTPSLIPLGYLEKIIDTMREYYPLTKNTQLNIEATPESVTEDFLAGLKRIGFHRISLGGQSFNNAILKEMKRRHTRETLKEKIGLIEKYGFDYNMDILYGWNFQDLAMFEDDIRQAVDIKLNHVSLYPLLERPEKGRKGKPRESGKKQKEMYTLGREILLENGYTQYSTEHFYKTNPNYYISANRSIPIADVIPIGIGCGGAVANQFIAKTTNVEDYIKAIEDDIHPIFYHKYDDTKGDINALLMTQTLTHLNLIEFGIDEFNKFYRCDILKDLKGFLNFFEYMDLIEIGSEKIKLKEDSYFTYTDLMSLSFFGEINKKYRNPVSKVK